MFRKPLTSTVRLSVATLFAALCLCLTVQPNLRANEKGKSDQEPPQRQTLKIASISFVPTKWDKAANATRIEREVRAAAKQGAQLVITPEGILEGYVVNEVIHEKESTKKAQLSQKFQDLAEPIDGSYVVRFQKLADELNIHLILGFLEAEKGKTFNTAALFGPDGKLVGKYHKTHFHQGYKVNPPGYTAGNSYPVFDIGGFKVGMMICFDRQLPEPARQLALNGADLIACPSYGSWGEWNTRLMQVRAYENQSYVVFAHPKQSLIIGRGGDILTEGKENSFVIHEVDITNLAKTRQSVRYRRPNTYRNLAQPDKKLATPQKP